LTEEKGYLSDGFHTHAVKFSRLIEGGEGFVMMEIPDMITLTIPDEDAKVWAKNLIDMTNMPITQEKEKTE